MGWDEERACYIAKDGRVVAPRLDSDGWDFFLARSVNDTKAEARICTGEGYIAFGMEKLEDYIDAIREFLRAEMPAGLEQARADLEFFASRSRTLRKALER